MFPLKVRGQAVALATITNFASNFAVSLALPSIQEGVGLAGEHPCAHATAAEGLTVGPGHIGAAAYAGAAPALLLDP